MTILRNIKGTVSRRPKIGLADKMRENGAEAGHADCKPVAEILARIGDKWSVLVVMLLGDGSLRFNELRRLINGISQRMLTLTLRGLERDGFVTRTVFAMVPPRVDYALTDLGHSLLEPISQLGDWAFAHRAQVEAARAKFDARPAPGTVGVQRIHAGRRAA